jgi:peptidoglycan hydrolase CwlO-like protein
MRSCQSAEEPAAKWSFRTAAGLLFLLPLIAWAVMPPTAAAPGAGDADEARRQIDATRADLDTVIKRLNDARARLVDVKRRQHEAEYEARTVARLVLKDEKAVVAVAEAIYKGGSSAAVAAVLSSQSLSELETRIKYLRSAQQVHTEDLEHLKTHRVELEARLNDLHAAREEAIAILDEVSALRAGLETRLAAQNQALEGIQDAIRRRQVQQETEAVAAAQGVAQEVEAAAAAVTAPAPTYNGPYSVDWDAIAECESGGNWHLDGVYDGGLQFAPATWLAYGGGEFADYAWQATREQQITIAERVLADQGPSAWPNCWPE